MGQNYDRLFKGLQSHPAKIDPNDDSYCARAAFAIPAFATRTECNDHGDVIVCTRLLR